jgi:diguanylate cyclase (GGDEF)-like protein
MIDADQFKLFNDTYGHGAGDDVLRTIGSILARTGEEHGAHVARLGGEEFAVLMLGMDDKRVLDVADGICLGVIGASVAHDRAELGLVSVSVGCATIIPETGNDLSLVMAAADAALYAAKASGRNQAIAASGLGRLADRRASAGPAMWSRQSHAA